MHSRRAVLAAGATGTVALSAGCLGFVLGDEPLEFDAAQLEPTETARADTGYRHVDTVHESHEETIEVAGVSREIHAAYWSNTYEKDVALQAVVDGGDLDEAAEEELDDDLAADTGDDEELDDDLAAVEDDEFDGAGEGHEPADDDPVDAPDPDEEVTAAFLVTVSMPAMEVLGTTYNPLAEMDSEELIAELDEESDSDLEIGELSEVETATQPILGEDRDVDVFETTTEVEGREVELALLVVAFGHEGDYLVLVGGYPADLEDEREALETVLGSVEHPIE